MGRDWFYENYDWNNAGGQGGFEPFALNNARAGCASILTVPMLDWVAKDTTSYSYPVARYGPQDSTDPRNPDAGDGRQNNVRITTNDRRDAHVPSRPARAPGDAPDTVYQEEWLQALRAQFGDLLPQLVPFVTMDSEVDLWNVTHSDVHPAPSATTSCSAAI